MPLPIILGAAAAGGQLVGDLLNRDAARRAQNKAAEAMKELLIPESETRRRADRYGDDYYTKSMGELNEGAFAYAGVLNPETLRTIAYSKMAPGRAALETQVAESDLEYNRGIKQQIAGIKAQPLPEINPMGVVEAGLGGYLGGKQTEMAESLIESQKKFLDLRANDLMNTENNTGFFSNSITGFGLSGIGKINNNQIGKAKVPYDNWEFDFWRKKRKFLE